MNFNFNRNSYLAACMYVSMDTYRDISEHLSLDTGDSGDFIKQNTFYFNPASFVNKSEKWKDKWFSIYFGKDTADLYDTYVYEVDVTLREFLRRIFPKDKYNFIIFKLRKAYIKNNIKYLNDNTISYSGEDFVTAQRVGVFLGTINNTENYLQYKNSSDEEKEEYMNRLEESLRLLKSTIRLSKLPNCTLGCTVKFDKDLMVDSLRLTISRYGVDTILTF